MGLLSLSAGALHTALECASYVLEQAAYRSSGVEALARELKAAGFADHHVRCRALALVHATAPTRLTSCVVSRLPRSNGFGGPRGAA